MEKRVRNRLVVVTLLILVVIVGIVYYSLTGSYSYYKTVKELRKDTSLIGVSVRVSGKVEKHSLKQDAKGYHFTISEENATLKVNYNGVLPQTFEEGKLVILEGKYKKGYVVDATKIITKCPSKYKARYKKKTEGK